MRKGERFSSREILKTGIALSGILCYLHAQNPPVFYRDLKPDNVMITERGTNPIRELKEQGMWFVCADVSLHQRSV